MKEREGKKEGSEEGRKMKEKEGKKEGSEEGRKGERQEGRQEGRGYVSAEIPGRLRVVWRLSGEILHSD